MLLLTFNKDWDLAAVSTYRTSDYRVGFPVEIHKWTTLLRTKKTWNRQYEDNLGDNGHRNIITRKHEQSRWHTHNCTSTHRIIDTERINEVTNMPEFPILPRCTIYRQNHLFTQKIRRSTSIVACDVSTCKSHRSWNWSRGTWSNFSSHIHHGSDGQVLAGSRCVPHPAPSETQVNVLLSDQSLTMQVRYIISNLN